MGGVPEQVREVHLPVEFVEVGHVDGVEERAGEGGDGLGGIGVGVVGRVGVEVVGEDVGERRRVGRVVAVVLEALFEFAEEHEESCAVVVAPAVGQERGLQCVGVRVGVAAEDEVGPEQARGVEHEHEVVGRLVGQAAPGGFGAGHLDVVGLEERAGEVDEAVVRDAVGSIDEGIEACHGGVVHRRGARRSGRASGQGAVVRGTRGGGSWGVLRIGDGGRGARRASGRGPRPDRCAVARRCGPRRTAGGSALPPLPPSRARRPARPLRGADRAGGASARDARPLTWRRSPRRATAATREG